MLKNNKKIKNCIKIIIIVLFTLLTLLIIQRHEHWSDEAQSYLLAEDTSMANLYYYMKYEGTPYLWVLLIKIYILLGGSYNFFFMLSLLCSVLGLILFEFKIKAPWYIKVIFPFTYYVFYQYTVVTRSYSLVFPLIMMLAILDKRKFDKPFSYMIVLILFMSISLHTFVAAGSIYFLMLFDTFMMKKSGDKISKSIYISECILFFSFLITLIITYPNSDHSFYGNSGRSIFHSFSEITIGSYLENSQDIIVSVIGLSIMLFSLKNKKEFLRFLILFIPTSLVLRLITFQIWQVGVLFFILIYYFIITNQINTNKYIKIMLVFIFGIQISWSCLSSIYDWNYSYSAGKEVANYLEEKGLLDKGYSIYGSGSNVTSVLPYFDRNIFQNYNTDCRFYFWKVDKGYLTEDELIKGEADIYIVSDFYNSNYPELIKFLNDYSKLDYNVKNYTSFLFIKNRIFENTSISVYIKKDIMTQIEE